MIELEPIHDKARATIPDRPNMLDFLFGDAKFLVAARPLPWIIRELSS